MGMLVLCIVLSGCRSDVSEPAGNDDLFASVTLVAASGPFSAPSSSVPDASGQSIYFTATGPQGPGVFKVGSAGGTATALVTGAPFAGPVDLVLSTDNRMIFVADSSAGSRGRIFALNIGGDMLVEVPGTAGTAPVALDLIQRSGQDRICFCGANAADGMKAVFEIPSVGADEPILRYKGAPLTSPTGIVSAKDGTLFIADNGTVYKLSGSTLAVLATGIGMGSPAGIALTPDERAVAVSSKDASGRAQVQIVDVQTGAKSVFNNVIGANSNPGGLHAARNAAGATGVYSWVDRAVGVYRLGQ